MTDPTKCAQCGQTITSFAAVTPGTPPRTFCSLPCSVKWITEHNPDAKWTRDDQ